LSGLSKDAGERLSRSGTFGEDGQMRTSEATPILGESTRDAYARAQRWVEREGDGESDQSRRNDETP
jgi:hypothetical protein